MTTTIARDCKDALEPLHAMIYFAPEAETEFTGLGLSAGHMAYFAGRAAPMGAVSAGVVSATFYNFNPQAVARVIPHAWSIASPEEILSARLRAADTALRRLLGDDVVASDEVVECAKLAREATQACLPDGKPLFGGHADLEWPEQPHLELWHGVSLLREFRGDAHIAVLQTAGLNGLQALVLHAATGKGFNADAAKKLRGWSDQDWSTAQNQLRAQELLDDNGELTEEGVVLREEVETATDTQSMTPWIHLGVDKIERLTGLGAELSKSVVKAGAIPSKLFTRN